VGVEPTTIDDDGHADQQFHEQVNVACYPPEADFVILSQEHPERAVDYDDYIRLRALYSRTKPAYPEVRAWPALSKV
jgi:hypothetical protein